MKKKLLLLTVLICSSAYPFGIGKSITVKNQTVGFAKFNLYSCSKENKGAQWCNLLSTQYLHSFKTASMHAPWFDNNTFYVIEAHINTHSTHYTLTAHPIYLSYYNCTATVQKSNSTKYELKVSGCTV